MNLSCKFYVEVNYSSTPLGNLIPKRVELKKNSFSKRAEFKNITFFSKKSEF